MSFSSPRHKALDSEKPSFLAASELNLDIANILNDCFASVFTREIDSPTPRLGMDTEVRDNSSDIVCSVDEVKSKLMNLNLYKFPGPDGFLGMIL